MNSAQFGCGAQAPPWRSTDPGSDAGRELFIFFLFWKKSTILPWLLWLTFFWPCSPLSCTNISGENCLFQSEPMKIRVVPLCPPTALYFLHLSLFLSGKKAVFVHSSNCRSFHESEWMFNFFFSTLMDFYQIPFSFQCSALVINVVFSG